MSFLDSLIEEQEFNRNLQKVKDFLDKMINGERMDKVLAFLDQLIQEEKEDKELKKVKNYVSDIVEDENKNPLEEKSEKVLDWLNK